MNLSGENTVRRALRPAVQRIRRRITGGPAPAAPAAPAAPPGPKMPAAERLLHDSALFDHEWYALVTGRERDRLEAVRHYRAKGSARGFHPHQLFDPAFFTANLDEAQTEKLGERDPLTFYLRNRLWWVRTHPLFDTKGYLRRVDDARHHPGGPIGHYSEIGAAAGVRPNAWLATTEDGNCPDLRQWITARHLEWHERDQSGKHAWTTSINENRAARVRAEHDGAPSGSSSGGPLVTVVLDPGVRETYLDQTLGTLAAQTLRDWELVVLDRTPAGTLAASIESELPGVSCSIVAADDSVPAGLNRALEIARGDYVAFLDAGDLWDADRLRLLAHVLQSGPAVVADILEVLDAKGETRYASYGQRQGHSLARQSVDLARVVGRRDLLSDAGFDVSLGGSWSFDLVTRLLERESIARVPVIGVRRDLVARYRARRLPHDLRPAVDHERVHSWVDVSLNRRLIDWADLATRDQDTSTVSVIIPTYDDWELTEAAVRSVLASDGVGGIAVDCVVWDNGSDPHVATVLDSLRLRHPGITLVHSAVNYGFALGNNLALAHARGSTVMFLNNDTTVAADWLVPVARTLADPEVLGCQPLLVYPTGSVQSAGVAFPEHGGLPHAFLQGFPQEDAAGVEPLQFRALTGAALAMRFDDVVALHGFDPIFTNGMEDVDLCQRLHQRRPGHFRVLPESPVVHYESRSRGRYLRSLRNRELYLERWAGRDEPRDDAALWGACGYRVVGHAVSSATGIERRLNLPMPMVVRESRLRVVEQPKSLRWAIKSSAPYGPKGEIWGDTHFARALASALRQRGQEVVIDHRGEFSRSSAHHDDVELVLHGLEAYKSSFENISIGWAISHPEMLSRREASHYDRLLAASVTWSQDKSELWGIDVEPMLQATDPSLFHPDRAVADTGHPVLFVGSSRKVYRPIVRDSVEAGVPISVYGDLWGRFVPQRYVKARYLDNTQLGAAYRSAGVVLNDHWEDMRELGFLSNRLFDAVASGARVVTDDAAGLEGIFGPSVQVYRTPEDLVRLTSLTEPDAVFGDDRSRRADAARVHREHSFTARAERLIEIAFEERRRRGFVR